ncbi:MAG: hypothetical protein IJU76_03120 [Desulfovibrionaceae bacterium]|nr:hypothetical protein [Desulfovibrionaceae bacterium]
MSRLNPMFLLYKEAVQAHFDELQDKKNIVRYKNRLVNIVKIPSVIAIDKVTGERKTGFIFLCRDIQSAYSKSDHLLKSKLLAKMTLDECDQVLSRFGVFAIVTTRDLPPEQILPEYYVRQYSEQYCDYGKNYAKFLPVRQHTMETLSGHLLLSFIASFLIIVVKNRLGIQDLRYVALPTKLVVPYSNEADEEAILEQDPLCEIFRESPSTLFEELRGQKADVFSGCIVPTCPVKKANDFYRAFGLESPTKIPRSGEKLFFELSDAENTINKALVFTQCPCPTEEDILAKRAKKQKTKEKDGEKSQIVRSEGVEKRGRGRPPGSKNKKTLERESALASNAGAASMNETKKRGRGRPLGSRNKKTLEREAARISTVESKK